MTFFKRLFILLITVLLLGAGFYGVTVAAQPGPAAATTPTCSAPQTASP